MDLNFTQEYEEFRAEVRGFLENNRDKAPSRADRSVRSEKRL
ncbi:MAG: acyl-CoA dehydrogenase, partial [Alphaproteobacteria bacterium]|nr:acyl-CoA dehydrogenase [Alphaproteobacteria bacterium]